MPAAAAVGEDYRGAKTLACVIVAVVTFVSLLIPPALLWDPGAGMLAWRSLQSGGPVNFVAEPDPVDISRDQLRFLTWWSPGQYFVPGAFTLLGLRLGPALTITSGLSLLCCLLGWIRVVKHFTLGPHTATLVVAFLSTFRYSTIPFFSYNGGEILLQAVLPWLILAAIRVPAMTAAGAAGLAGLMVLIGFFAKLTGVSVAAAALIAGSAASYQRSRRIGSGMIAGAIGATVAFGFLLATWFSRGFTPANGNGWYFPGRAVFYAFSAPWGAGVSWENLLASFLPHRSPIDPPTLAVILFSLVPAFIFGITMVFGYRRCVDNAQIRALLTITVSFYAACALSIALTYMHGSPVGTEERHLRSAGTLVFVCVVALASALPKKAIGRSVVLVFCGLMSIAGVCFMVRDARRATFLPVDPYSRIRQDEIDSGAIEFVQDAFARDGRDDLFVLERPGVASAFPPGARVLFAEFLLQTEPLIKARHYAGRVRGGVYVLIRTATAQTVKGALLLKRFTDYPAAAWEPHRFGNTTVFVQGAPELAGRDGPAGAGRVSATLRKFQ